MRRTHLSHERKAVRIPTWPFDHQNSCKASKVQSQAQDWFKKLEGTGERTARSVTGQWSETVRQKTGGFVALEDNTGLVLRLTRPGKRRRGCTRKETEGRKHRVPARGAPRGASRPPRGLCVSRSSHKPPQAPPKDPHCCPTPAAPSDQPRSTAFSAAQCVLAVF